MIEPSFDRLGFVHNGLVRHSAERDASMERHRADPAAAVVAIAGDVPILLAGREGATSLLPLAAIDRVPSRHEEAFLGTLDGRPVFAALLDAGAAETFRDDPAFLALDLRSIAVQGVVPADELGILAEAKALLFWHSRHRFCPNCGAPTRVSAAGFRRDCGSCGAQHFPRTDPVAIMLVARDDACLLGRQPRFVPGMYSCLAGFIEPGETIEDAVRRETQEEAGIRVGRVRYLASQPWPFPASLMIGCIADALSEDIVLDREELEDGRWFTRNEVVLMLTRQHPDGFTTPPTMAIANYLLRSWVAEGGPD